MPTIKSHGRSVPFIWLILAAAPLVGCGDEVEPKQETAPAGQTDGDPEVKDRGEAVSITADSARGNFQIRIRPEGGTIPLNEPFAITLDLFDPATGLRLKDLGGITLDARMPAHGHGMLRDVNLVPTGEGSLRAEGLLFHMIGHWEFHVDITRGPRVERAQASYELTL